MAKKFHVNLETGETGECSATKRPCPHGGDEVHGASEAEARVLYERAMENDTVPSAMSKPASAEAAKPAFDWIRMPGISAYSPVGAPLPVGEDDRETVTKISFSCENHDAPGECTEECAQLVSMMSESPGMDYDETGTAYGPPQSYSVYKFDGETRGSYEVVYTPTELLSDEQYEEVEYQRAVADMNDAIMATMDRPWNDDPNLDAIQKMEVSNAADERMDHMIEKVNVMYRASQDKADKAALARQLEEAEAKVRRIEEAYMKMRTKAGEDYDNGDLLPDFEEAVFGAWGQLLEAEHDRNMIQSEIKSREAAEAEVPVCDCSLRGGRKGVGKDPAQCPVHGD